MNRDNEERRGYDAENKGNADAENEKKAGGAGEKNSGNAGMSAEEQTAGKGGVEKSCHLCTTFLVVPYKKQHLIYSLILYIIYSYFKPEEVGFTNI